MIVKYVYIFEWKGAPEKEFVGAFNGPDRDVSDPDSRSLLLDMAERNILDEIVPYLAPAVVQTLDTLEGTVRSKIIIKNLWKQDTAKDFMN